MCRKSLKREKSGRESDLVNVKVMAHSVVRWSWITTAVFSIVFFMHNTCASTYRMELRSSSVAISFTSCSQDMFGSSCVFHRSTCVLRLLSPIVCVLKSVVFLWICVNSRWAQNFDNYRIFSLKFMNLDCHVLDSNINSFNEDFIDLAY